MKRNEVKDNIVRYFLSNSLEFLVLQIMGFQG